MPENIPVVDDLFISLKVIEQGKDFIYSKDAVAREFVAPSLKWEYDRKVKIYLEVWKLLNRSGVCSGERNSH